ncbi:glutamate synthase (NADPH/NADH) small chain [Clostridium cavendishii DSM 21758]|uniref:Glutamate synthase (NADPH/NADH) small chain n=1 Tax=Clostridium cavendishii DSM 21758 TaxID=1121302 RepID=A0A1M6UUM4_9CLOT|nr:glutamate synthase subunit beta [Clostridium cavendishii]SHK72811.1 glutamate synthase (NADPH/NADH) small chain [Clostridium cavendishii DSM 21758]
MGKSTGFLEYDKELAHVREPLERIGDFNEIHGMLSKEKQEIQGARCMDCGIPFCQSGIILNGAVSGCPINNLIPEWNDLIYRGKWKEALNRLKKTNNFPEFTGRVCPAPCEAGCTAGINGPSISIKENECSIIERAYAEGYIKAQVPEIRTNKKIAIVGSGPAGLSAADQLNKLGHNVTVFERYDRVGGLLMYGIPNMKLDKNIVQRIIELMKEEGINFITNTNVGKDYDVDSMIKEYDAVILACGASKARNLDVPGRDLKGVHFAVEFLRANTKSLLDSNLEDENYISAKDKNVIVIGGGDTGTDCVGTSLRHGCKSLVQFEIMDKLPLERAANNPWPQWPRIHKVDYGQEEFEALYGKDPRVYGINVKKLEGDEDDNLLKVHTVDVKWEKSQNGRYSIIEVEGTERIWEADLILLAMGFVGTEDYISKAFGVELDKKNNIKAEYGCFRTNVDKVFVAGDARRGQSLVVWAINEGRAVAEKVHDYLLK